MLNTVLYYVKTSLDGLTFPTGLTFDGVKQVPNLKAIVSVPYGLTASAQPIAFVWGSTVNERRQTMGGPRAPQVNTRSPFRDMQFRVEVTLIYAIPNSQKNIDSIFPAVFDSVIELLRGVQMPITLDDPLTGRPVQITDIGEQFDSTIPSVMQLVDQRYWRYTAKIMMRVKAKVQQ